MPERHIIKISPKGEVSIEVSGVQGSGCLESTKAIERRLGGKVISDDLSGEFYEEQQIQDSNFA